MRAGAIGRFGRGERWSSAWAGALGLGQRCALPQAPGAGRGGDGRGGPHGGRVAGVGAESSERSPQRSASTRAGASRRGLGGVALAGRLQQALGPPWVPLALPEPTQGRLRTVPVHLAGRLASAWAGNVLLLDPPDADRHGERNTVIRIAAETRKVAPWSPDNRPETTVLKQHAWNSWPSENHPRPSLADADAATICGRIISSRRHPSPTIRARSRDTWDAWNGCRRHPHAPALRPPDVP